MFKRTENEITYKKKKFTIGGFNASQAIALRARFKRADVKNDEIGAIELMVDFLDIAIMKPKVSKKTLAEGMSLDDLHGLFQAVAKVNGFLAGNVPKRKTTPEKN